MISEICRKFRQNPMTIVISTFAAFGGLLYGYDTDSISGIIQMKFFFKIFVSKQINDK